MVGNNGKEFSIAEPDRTFGKDGASDLIYRATRTYGVKTKRAENIPGGSGSAIIISRNTKRTIGVPNVHHLADSPLCLPRLAREVVEIGNMEARLVTLRVKSDEARCIGKLSEELIL